MPNIEHSGSVLEGEGVIISPIEAVQYDFFWAIIRSETSSPGQLNGTKQTLPSIRQTPLPPKASLSIIAVGKDTLHPITSSMRGFFYKVLKLAPYKRGSKIR